MEKLQPLVTHRFWILSGLIVVLSLLGWYLGSDKLVEFTKKQTDKIYAADSNLPEGEIHPNQDWIFELDAINGNRKSQSNKSAAELFAEQVKVMDWPASIAANFHGVPFRGPAITNSTQNKDDIPAHYRNTVFEDVIKPLPEIVTPLNEKTNEGIVKFNVTDMRYFPNWGTYTPTWKEMWDVQEDYWLTRSLLGAIAEVNRQEKSIHYDDASIQEIVRIELHAGSKPVPKDYSGGTPPGFKNNKSDDGVPDPVTVTSGGGGGRTGARKSRTGGTGQQNAETVPVTTGITIVPVDVFGIPMAEGSAEQTPSNTTLSVPEPDEPVEPVSTKKGSEPRYVEKKPELPFKTRGFILVLDMKSESLPLLLKELNQLEWPVEIRRVHWKLEDADLEGENRQLVQFHTDTEDRKKVKRTNRGDGGRGSQAAVLSVGDPKKKSKGNRRQRRPHQQVYPNRITTADKINDRRSDIQVEIAGVLTIYQPPDAELGIEVPTLKTIGKAIPNEKPKSSPKAKKDETSKLKMDSNKLKKDSNK